MVSCSQPARNQHVVATTNGMAMRNCMLISSCSVQSWSAPRAKRAPRATTTFVIFVCSAPIRADSGTAPWKRVGDIHRRHPCFRPPAWRKQPFRLLRRDFKYSLQVASARRVPEVRQAARVRTNDANRALDSLIPATKGRRQRPVLHRGRSPSHRQRNRRLKDGRGPGRASGNSSRRRSSLDSMGCRGRACCNSHRSNRRRSSERRVEASANRYHSSRARVIPDRPLFSAGR